MCRLFEARHPTLYRSPAPGLHLVPVEILGEAVGLVWRRVTLLCNQMNEGSHVHRHVFRFFSSRTSALSLRFRLSRTLVSSASASRIYLDVVVTPKSGPPVANLQQQDFVILDNKTPQHITSFQAFGGSQDPIQVVLVIDAVNISYESLAYEREQIDKFLRTNGGRLAAPTALAFFTEKARRSRRAFPPMATRSALRSTNK